MGENVSCIAYANLSRISERDATVDLATEGKLKSWPRTLARSVGFRQEMLRSTIVTSTVAAACVLVYQIANSSWLTHARRFMRRLTVHPRLALLNPKFKDSDYSANVQTMLEELFDSIGARVAIVEYDICETPFEVSDDGNFDGFIIPDCRASAYDKDIPWIGSLKSTVKRLHEKRRPLLGICFGHQVVAQALGGRVEENAKGKRGVGAASVLFDVTQLGASLGLGEAGRAKVSLLYHHYDIVTRLPSCAANLGCSATAPAHAAALFASATAARTAVTRGTARGPNRPHGITLQGQPEYSTPTGVRVLEDVLRVSDAPLMGDAWLAERVSTIRDEATTAHAHAMTRAAVALLWPEALAVASK